MQSGFVQVPFTARRLSDLDEFKEERRIVAFVDSSASRFIGETSWNFQDLLCCFSPKYLLDDVCADRLLNDSFRFFDCRELGR